MRIYNIILFIMILTTQIVSAETTKIDYVCTDKDNSIITNEIVSVPPIPTNIAIDAKTNGVTTDATRGDNKLCPDGKLPKLKDEISKTIYKEKKRLPSTINEDAIAESTYEYGAYYDWADSRQQKINYGISAYLTQHNPYVEPSSFHSLAEIGVLASDGDYIEVGWRKASSDHTRLFVYWWDNSKPQCYNGCGWVQYSASKYPGMRLYNDNNGVQYAIQNYQGNWWIWYKNEWIGYYPGNLWNNQFTNGDKVLYYGEVAASKPSTTTDMGNGIFASRYIAAKIFYQSYFDGNMWRDSITSKWASTPSRYSIYSTGSNSLRYGGPGITGIT